VGKVVICDECIPRGFAALLGDSFDVTTVAARGWAGADDDQLLDRLHQIPGAVLVTMDRGFRWVRPRRVGRVAVVLVHARSSQLVDLVELAPDVVSAVRRAQPGRVITVGMRGRRG
jgi:hypothetical protein